MRNRPGRCHQYGGALKPDNAAALCSRPGVDGALIGGAQPARHQFLVIIRAGIREPQTEWRQHDGNSNGKSRRESIMERRTKGPLCPNRSPGQIPMRKTLPVAKDDLETLPDAGGGEETGIVARTALLKPTQRNALTQYGPNEIKRKKTNPAPQISQLSSGPDPWTIEVAVILSPSSGIGRIFWHHLFCSFKRRDRTLGKNAVRVTPSMPEGPTGDQGPGEADGNGSTRWRASWCRATLSAYGWATSCRVACACSTATRCRWISPALTGEPSPTTPQGRARRVFRLDRVPR